MVARTVENQMYMQFTCKQGTYFGPVHEYRPYAKHVTQIKENTLKSLKRLTLGVFLALILSALQLRKMDSNISIKTKENFL